MAVVEEEEKIEEGEDVLKQKVKEKEEDEDKNFINLGNVFIIFNCLFF